MMKKITNLLFSLTLSGTAMFSFAQQNYVHKVIVLNEGSYDYAADTQKVAVSIGAYDPVNKTYTYFDTINEMRWASDVVVDDQQIYAAGDTLLLVYDKNTYQRKNSVGIAGIRKLALWNDNILVSRKSGNGYNSYFQAFNKSNLTLTFELDSSTGPKYSSSDMVVYNDSCYLSVNNAFEWGNYKGILGIIDLKNQKYVKEINLGSDGLNPDNVMIEGNKIYTLNNKDWSGTGSSISVYDASTNEVSTFNVTSSSGCGTSVKALNYIYYQEYTLNKLARFDINSKSVYDTLDGTLSYYGLITDTINNILYAVTTDYATYGKTFIMQPNGVILDSFSVGVAAGPMAFDIRQTTSVEEINNALLLKVYPNPVSSILNLIFSNTPMSYSLSISDVLGKLIYYEDVKETEVKKIINVENYKQGIYLLTIKNQYQNSTYKIVK